MRAYLGMGVCVSARVCAFVRTDMSMYVRMCALFFV